MSTVSQNISKVFVHNIEGFPSPGQLFASSWPDLVMILGGFYYVLELRDHTFMTSTRKGDGGVLQFVTCVQILLF